MEAADLSLFGFVLVQELQVSLIEFLEKFVPANFFQIFFLGAEIDPEQACMASLFGSLHGRRNAVTLVDPFFYLRLVRRGVAFTHVEQLCCTLVSS
jgi:hypothetical protein